MSENRPFSTNSGAMETIRHRIRENLQQSATQAYIQEQCTAIAVDYGAPLQDVEAACQRLCVARPDQTCNQTFSALRSGDPALRAEFLVEMTKL